MVILLHSSKTMRTLPLHKVPLRLPQLLNKAKQLNDYLTTLSSQQLQKIMKISPVLAEKTYRMIHTWTIDPKSQSLALDSFIGDIYSGLQADQLSPTDRDYADEHLRILSGLYGIIRPHDGICPYRLEMAYRLPDLSFANLYKYWGESIANCLPTKELIINLASVEYSKAVLPFIDAALVVTPHFLTINPATGETTFVVVHAKIARGAFARWLIVNRVNNLAALMQFNDLGYQFNQTLSSATSPTFVCNSFGGKGLSMRLR